MKTVFSDQHRLQNATAELSEGKLIPIRESPKRADNVLREIQRRGLGDVLEPDDFGLELISCVHEQGYLDFLHHAYEQ